MPEPVPAAVVFDMDGVLLDSEPFWQEAEVEVFATVGLDLEPEDCRRTMGMRVDQVVDYWAERRPWDEGAGSRPALVGAILDGVVRRIRARGERLPGVEAALESARRRGCRVGLASSSPERVIVAVLEALDLGGAFEATVSAEHELRGKPAPDVYRTACRRLGVEPRWALAIEDSLAGLEAARRAGMGCLMVPDASLSGRPELEEATLVLGSLEELDETAWQLLGRALEAGRPAPASLVDGEME